MNKVSGSFDTRVGLCQAWSGLRGQELNEASGFTDCEFVHRACFIGGAWSKETAVAMAVKSIEDAKKNQ